MRIIIANEKHTTRYMDASTDEQWAQSALQLLTERWNAGYWYGDPDETYRSLLEEPTLTPEQIDALPTEALRKQELKKAQNQRRWETEKGFYADWYERARQVVESQDLTVETLGTRFTRTEPRAWTLLRERDEAEYEHVELEDLETP